MPISKELQEVYASAPNDVRYVETLEITHSRFTQKYFFTNDLHKWRFMLEDGTLQTFEPVPFEVTMPAKDTGGNQDLQIGLCNVGEEMMDALELANQKPSENIRCVFRLFLDIPNSRQQNNPGMELFITDVAVNLQTISAVATRFDVLNRLFPNKIYTTTDFPGLRR